MIRIKEILEQMKLIRSGWGVKRDCKEQGGGGLSGKVEMFLFLFLLIGLVLTGVYTFVKCHLDVYLYVNFIVWKL